jgi:ferritin-like metal-binding protein YciE
MGSFTKDVKTMDDLLLHGLQDICYAEQQISKALPKMIDQATNRDLATGLKNHLEVTQKQIEQHEAFAKLGKEPSGTQCPASWRRRGPQRYAVATQRYRCSD